METQYCSTGQVERSESLQSWCPATHQSNELPQMNYPKTATREKGTAHPCSLPSLPVSDALEAHTLALILLVLCSLWGLFPLREIIVSVHHLGSQVSLNPGSSHHSGRAFTAAGAVPGYPRMASFVCVLTTRCSF